MLRNIATGLLIWGCLSLPSVAQGLDGLWRSEGYGYVFEINNKILEAFEVTTRTCVRGFTAKRDSSSFVTERRRFELRMVMYILLEPGIAVTTDRCTPRAQLPIRVSTGCRRCPQSAIGQPETPQWTTLKCLLGLGLRTTFPSI